MTSPLDRERLGEVSELVAERMGLSFPEDRWPDLARGLEAAAKELGFEHPDACARWLRAGELTARQVETLASHLTVGETYFLRDPASFEVLETEVLPALVARRARAGAGRSLRMWSAGCCTGEEAYSLAISCLRALPDPRAWSVSILATDINTAFLRKATAGVYSAWSFRGAPAWLRERFFTPAPDEKLAIDPRLQAMVHFRYLNLAEDPYPSLHNHTSAMDVIFCRNVLMYFTPEHQRRVVAGLHRCLVEGGCLFVNPAEAISALFPMFEVETVGEVSFYRKTSRRSAAGYSAARDIAPTVPVVDPLPESLAPVVAVAPASPAVQAPARPPVAPSAAPNAGELLVAARARADEGRLEEALALCAEAIAAERTSVVARYLSATICHELGRHDDAVAGLGKVLYLDPDFVLAHHALGGLYERLGQRRESRRHFAIALSLLSNKSRDELVPESDGMTCGRLVETVRAMTEA